MSDTEWFPASDGRGYVRGKDQPQILPAPVSWAEAHEAALHYDAVYRLREWAGQRDDGEIETAASNLKPFAWGEEVYFERFGQTAETARIFDDAVPREKIAYLAHADLLTAEACGRLQDAAEREQLYRQLTGYYEKVGVILTALHEIGADCEYPVWIRAGWILKHELGDEGFFYWNSWSRQSKKYPGSSELRRLWDRSGDHPKPVTLGSLLHYAKGGTRG